MNINSLHEMASHLTGGSMARPRKVDQLADIADFACDIPVVHMDVVRAARAGLPSGAELTGLVDLFAALADPTRLRIIAALAGRELCVRDLAVTVEHSQSAVSHQLRVLRRLDLVRSRRIGRRVYYALDDDHVTSLYAGACDHVGHRDSALGSAHGQHDEPNPTCLDL
jgi:ArsR family transcriptional regulator